MARTAILDDPGQCHFDPSSLVCKAGQTDQCLSEPQVAALKTIYSGLHDASGNTIIPGYPPGGESGPVAWTLWITGAEPKRIAGTLIYGFGTGYFADMVFDKPDWDFHRSKRRRRSCGGAGKDRVGARRRRTRISAPSGPRAASSCNITAGATRRSRRRVRSSTTSLSRPRWAESTTSGPSIGCSWRRACSIAARASRPMRSAACLACPRRAATRARCRGGPGALGRGRRGADQITATSYTRRRSDEGHRGAAPVVPLSGRRANSRGRAIVPTAASYVCSAPEVVMGSRHARAACRARMAGDQSTPITFRRVPQPRPGRSRSPGHSAPRRSNERCRPPRG